MLQTREQTRTIIADSVSQAVINLHWFEWRFSDTQIGLGLAIHTCVTLQSRGQSHVSDNSQSNAISEVKVAIVVWNKQFVLFFVFEFILSR